MPSPSPASQSLRDFGQVQRLVMLINLMTGCVLWAAAGLMKAPLAVDEDYGDFISGIDAELWAMPMAIGAALHILGQAVNGDRRLSPWVTPTWRLIGATICTLVLIAFFMGGFLMAPLQLFTLLHFMQSAVFGGLCIWFVWMAVKDLRGALGMMRSS